MLMPDWKNLVPEWPLSLIVNADGSVTGSKIIFVGNGNDTLLRGGDFNDFIYAYTGNDVIYGGKGKNLLHGGNGVDRFCYDASSDGDFADTITDYQAGEDVIVLEDGLFVMDAHSINTSATFGSNIGDVLLTLSNGGKITVRRAVGENITYESRGTLHTLRINSGTGVTCHYFTGTDGNDTLYSNSDGEDTFYGGAGNDTMYGFNCDLFFGGDGNDVIFSGTGANTLYGGNGADRFCYDASKKNGDYDDIIDDYVAGEDVIVLKGSLHLASGEVSGKDAILTLSDGGKITLKGAANLSITFEDDAGTKTILSPEEWTTVQQTSPLTATSSSMMASSVPIVGSPAAQLSSLISTTQTGNLGALPGTGLASPEASGSSLIAAGGSAPSNPLANQKTA